MADAVTPIGVALTTEELNPEFYSTLVTGLSDLTAPVPISEGRISDEDLERLSQEVEEWLHDHSFLTRVFDVLERTD